MVNAARGDDWTEDEVVATVGDYLTMLLAELADEPYSKAEHRRTLLPSLSPERTESAVEFKHQNISAVMTSLGLPHIRGYRPARNYQQALEAEVKRRLSEDPELREALGAPTQ